MFDNQSPQLNTPNNQGAMPPNKIPAGEPEDIFAATDNQAAGNSNVAPKPPQFQPKATANQAPANGSAFTQKAAAATEPYETKQDRKYIVIGLAAIIILVVVLIGMIALAYYKANSGKNSAAIAQPAAETNTPNAADSADNEENTNNQPAGVIEETATSTEEEQKGEMILDEITDTDGDGLTDGEEKRQGTNLNNSDTDGDGLFDREETRIYKTNPLIADTDGDGYNDGNEVKNNYNPNGAGKLYELPQ
jgi:hypothetical protein